MNWFSALVLFAVIWFMTLFVVLPLRLKTQGDVGSVVPGTQKSAPVNAQIKARMLITTIAAAIIWAIVATVIIGGYVTVEDLENLYR